MVISSTKAVDVSIQPVSPVLSVGAGVCAKALGAKIVASKKAKNPLLPCGGGVGEEGRRYTCGVCCVCVGVSFFSNDAAERPSPPAPSPQGRGGVVLAMSSRISSPAKFSAISGSVARGGKRWAALSGLCSVRAQKVGAVAFRLRGAVAST